VLKLRLPEKREAFQKGAKLEAGAGGLLPLKMDERELVVRPLP
jgi:hypothetical protein